MKVVIIDEKKIRLNRILEWFIYMVGYALVLITVSVIFKNTIYIDNAYFGIWGLISAIIIYLLNKTVKPILFLLTLPITGITLGLFYPFLNVIILNITDLLLGSHFKIDGLFMAFIVAIFISVMNILMQKIIIEPIIRRER